MREIIGGYTFRKLADWITYAEYYCLKDLRYVNIKMGEEYCPFCKQFIEEYYDDEEKRIYKEVQDVTFEVGVKILKKLEDYVEIQKKVPNSTSSELILSVREIIMEALYKYFLRVNKRVVIFN